MLAKHKATILICALLVVLAASMSMAAVRMPPGSFITRPVTSPDELADLVLKDQVVALRYSKHFGMEPNALANYFRNNLTLSAISTTGDYPLYFIDKNGQILRHKKRLQAGTRVFVGPLGELIMHVGCGNPFAKALPKLPAPAPPPAPAPQPVAPVEPVPELAKVDPMTIPGPPPEPVEMAVLAAVPIELVPIPVVATEAASKSLAWILPGLAGAALIIGKDDVVPEPASVLVLSVGLAGLLGVGYRRSRR